MSSSTGDSAQEKRRRLAELPEISEFAMRKLALQWRTLLSANDLTGEHLHWHERERDRLRRVAAQSPTSGSILSPDDESAADETGIYSSIAAAEGRFASLMAEYWPLLVSFNAGYEGYRGWLEIISRQVSAEVSSVWAGGSDGVRRWYERACRPAVEECLDVLVEKGVAQAITEELTRLEAQSKKMSDSRAGEGLSAETPEHRKRRKRVPNQQFPNRAKWLRDRLTECDWSKSDPAGFGGPDRKTIERILRGQQVGNHVVVKLANAFKTKLPDGVRDIPQD